MKEHIYVVVIVSPDNNAKTAVVAGDRSLKGLSLSRVLDQGWSPVRETPMGGSGENFCSLVLLEREADGERTRVGSSPRASRSRSEEALEVDGEEGLEIVEPEPIEASAKRKKPKGQEESKQPAATEPEEEDVSFDFLNELD